MEICLIDAENGVALLAGWHQDSQLGAAFTVIDPALNGPPDYKATHSRQPSELKPAIILILLFWL